MILKTLLAIGLVSVALILSACAGQSPVTANTITPPAQKPSVPATPAATASQTVPANISTPAPISTPKPAGRIKATEIAASVSGDTVTVPVSTVQNNWNSHFMVDTPDGKMGFMAYVLDGNIYVRASVCPPCHGKTYTLDGSTLVCDVCATTFNAQTGKGIAGPCVNYPKASVQYAVANGNVAMKMSDLETAYQTTLKFQR